MKDLKVSSETHSLLFSLKNKLIVAHNKKFTYDEVMKVLLRTFYNANLQNQGFEPLDVMYQLEEKP